MRILVCLLMICFSCMLGGGVILDDGLILQGGTERVEMRVGQRVYLKAQTAVWKYPVLKGLKFSSQKPWVAYVDTYGWIRAETAGKTVISVWNDSGANGTIEVIVRGRARERLRLIPVAFILLFGSAVVFLGRNLFRCFE